MVVTVSLVFCNWDMVVTVSLVFCNCDMVVTVSLVSCRNSCHHISYKTTVKQFPQYQLQNTSETVATISQLQNTSETVATISQLQNTSETVVTIGYGGNCFTGVL
jgi:hypothetical protein